jgi:hypothetical protein
MVFSLIVCGSEFHRLGPAHLKDLRPLPELHLGTLSRVLSDEERVQITDDFCCEVFSDRRSEILLGWFVDKTV